MQHIGVDESLIDEFKAFATDPDEDELMAFMERIKEFDTDVKVNFLIEVILIAFRDGEFDEGEQEMFNDYVDMFELEDTKDDIMYMALALVNKDIDLALSLYTAKKEFFLKYNYMFEMIGVDIEKELKKVYNWEWIDFKLEIGEVKDNNFVASEPVSVQQFCIYLNSKLMSGELKHIVNTPQFEINSEVIIKDIESVNLKFNDKFFIYNGFPQNNILGINSANDFCKFVRECTDEQVALLQFTPKEMRGREYWYSLKLSQASFDLLSPNERHYIPFYGEWSELSSEELRFNWNRDIFKKINPNEQYAFRVMKVGKR